jgi:hypothetical protein
MKSTSAKILLSLLFLILAYGSAEAAGLKGEALPRVFSYDFRQIGATDLMVEIRGSDMPLPQVSNYGYRTMITLPGA